MTMMTTTMLPPPTPNTYTTTTINPCPPPNQTPLHCTTKYPVFMAICLPPPTAMMPLMLPEMTAIPTTSTPQKLPTQPDHPNPPDHSTNAKITCHSSWICNAYTPVFQAVNCLATAIADFSTAIKDLSADLSTITPSKLNQPDPLLPQPTHLHLNWPFHLPLCPTRPLQLSYKHN